MSGALTYIEIDIPYCALTYGVLPCEASLVNSPPTGTAKCFNTLSTCQDTENIDLQDVTLRFAVDAIYLPKDIDCLPYVDSVQFSPAVVSLGESLGQRASLKVVFRDYPHSDAGAGLDKYHAERPYNPYQQGTFWGRFRKRQPFLRGAPVRWMSGFVGQSLAEMETRHFFIESFEGPNDNGIFTITAKDVLKFLDGDRAQVPVLSNGFLVSAIDEDDTAAVLSPAGIGNAEYPTFFYGTIGGNETCLINRSGDNLTLARAQLGTVASSHEAQDRVQVSPFYDGINPVDIIVDFLLNYTDTPSDYIDYDAWMNEVNTNLNRVYTAIITEPTPVSKLISELIEQGPLVMWDDNVAQKLRLQVLRGIPTDAALYDDSNVMKGALSVGDQPEKRVSQVWVYYGQIDPTKRVDDPDNYRSCRKVVDQVAEDNFGAPAIKKIFARWIPAFGSTVAESLGAKVLSRYTTAPRKLSYEVFKQEAALAPELGQGYRFEWWNLQDESGARESVPIQVTRLNPTPFSWKVDAEEMLFSAPQEDLDDRQIVIDFNAFNVNLKTVHDSLFPPLEIGQELTVTIAAGVLVGSTSPSIPAFDIGDWAGSPTINVINLGRIQGKGGNGGNGGTSGAGQAGQPGGVALYTRHAITLTDTGSEIWGGGGGGGGSGTIFFLSGVGGGGGAGQTPGAAGANFSGVGGNANADPGTLTAGGDGGVISSGGSLSGGDGGDPGQAGGNGSSGASSGGAGGAAGAAIDGISFVTTSGSAGDRRGPTIN